MERPRDRHKAIVGRDAKEAGKTEKMRVAGRQKGHETGEPRFFLTD